MQPGTFGLDTEELRATAEGLPWPVKYWGCECMPKTFRQAMISRSFYLLLFVTHRGNVKLLSHLAISPSVAGELASSLTDKANMDLFIFPSINLSLFVFLYHRENTSHFLISDKTRESHMEREEEGPGMQVSPSQNTLANSAHVTLFSCTWHLSWGH